MPFREIDAVMRAYGQITSNFLTQASWRLYEIRQPPTSLCTTSNILMVAIVMVVRLLMVIMLVMLVMVVVVVKVVKVIMEKQNKKNTHAF